MHLASEHKALSIDSPFEYRRRDGLKGSKNKEDKVVRLPKGQPQGESEGSLIQISF